MSQPKIVAIMEVRNEAAIIGHTLRVLSELVDEIVVKDDGSTDATLEIIKTFPKVAHIWQKIPTARTEVRDRNQLIQLALQRGADWILFTDADEVFEPKMSTRIRELVVEGDKNNISHYRFQKAWLWGDRLHYRTDNPEKFFAFMPHRLFKAEPTVYWAHPTPSPFVRLAKWVLGIQKLKPQVGIGPISGLQGKTIDVDDIVIVHYAAENYNTMIKKHISYAVQEARFHPRRKSADIVEWAFNLLDTNNLQLAPVPREWIWSWQTEYLAALNSTKSVD